MCWRRTLPAALAGLAFALAGEAQTARICAVQGTGSTPNLLGSRVTVAGVVTADFTTTDQRGFFLQDPGCDGDPATSDGIWVSLGARTASATAGRRVMVAGRVNNDNGLTNIQLESLIDEGPYPGGVESVRYQPSADPSAASTQAEALEGMVVSLPAQRVVAATDHFGEAYLMPESSGVTRLFRGQEDGRKVGLASPAAWLALHHGDRVLDAAGPLTFTFGEWKVLLRPSRLPEVVRAGTAPPSASSSPPTLSFATYNLANLFDSSDDPGKEDPVPSPAEYATALARRAGSIARLLGSPDVLAVQEVEKAEVLADLLAQPELLPAGYRAVLVDGPDPRGIDVGLLYRSERFTLRSFEARQACSTLGPESGAVACTLSGGGQGFELFARPPLVVKLQGADGERLTVISNHLKAQEDGSVDDGQRLAQATVVRALVEELKAQEPEAALIVLGDLNDFEGSAPLAELTSGGRLVDLHTRAAARPYSYSYRGQALVLDYVLVDSSLAGRVAETGPVHVNVDFGDPGPGAPADAVTHVSDHDPVRVVLRPR